MKYSFERIHILHIRVDDDEVARRLSASVRINDCVREIGSRNLDRLERWLVVSDSPSLLTNVWSMAGGWKAWQDSGAPAESCHQLFAARPI